MILSYACARAKSKSICTSANRQKRLEVNFNYVIRQTFFFAEYFYSFARKERAWKHRRLLTQAIYGPFCLKPWSFTHTSPRWTAERKKNGLFVHGRFLQLLDSFLTLESIPLLRKNCCLLQILWLWRTKYTKTVIVWPLLHEVVSLMICCSVSRFKSSGFLLHGFFDL